MDVQFSLVLGTESVSHQVWCRAVSASALLWASFYRLLQSRGDPALILIVNYPSGFMLDPDLWP